MCHVRHTANAAAVAAATIRSNAFHIVSIIIFVRPSLINFLIFDVGVSLKAELWFAWPMIAKSSS